MTKAIQRKTSPKGTPLKKRTPKAELFSTKVENKTPRTKCVPIFALSDDLDTSCRHEPSSLPRNPKRVRGIWVRNSLRWADCYKVPQGPYSVPFIDKLGRFTGTTCYKWNCDPRQLVATVISTVSHRMQVYARRHNACYTVDKYSPAILRACVYYCMSKNSWFWDRILFFLRDLKKYGKLILTFVIRFVCKENDYKRFVYGQVSSQTNWLLFRARKPRDKFAFIQGGKTGNMRNFDCTSSSIPNGWRYGICNFASAISHISYTWLSGK